MSGVVLVVFVPPCSRTDVGESFPQTESGFAATTPSDFTTMSSKITTRITTEITIQRCQNGPHFRSLSRKSTNRNVFSKVRGQKLDGVISGNRFAQKLDWDRKSMCVYHPKRTNMFSSENLRFENFDDRLEMIRGTSTWLQTTGSVRARPRGANLVIARSASYVRTVVQNSSVRVFVCSSVRKIIDFCEEYMKGVRVLLSTGTLGLRFSRIQKVIVAK